MNVVHSGDSFQIYGNSLETYEKLPNGTYEVKFSKFTGFFLSPHADLTVNEERVYGSSPEKVNKVLKSFSATDRNLGVILSGRKGIGKSLFARLLAAKAFEYDLPLILVSQYIPGIADFISSIEQEVIVLFDEFEKTFGVEDGRNPQDEMLPLFDGIDGGKKLFIITCNEVRKLSTYLINRPGRFHYHFVLGNPTPEEVQEYMEDKLEEQYHDTISKLIGLSMSMDLTYDVLRAIAFELNNGYSLEETMADLNISKEDTPRYNIRAEFSDGSVRQAKDREINMYDSEEMRIWLGKSPSNFDGDIRIGFYPSDINIDVYHGGMTIDSGLVELYVDPDDFDMDDPNEKAEYEHLRNLQLVKIKFNRLVENPINKYIV